MWPAVDGIMIARGAEGGGIHQQQLTLSHNYTETCACYSDRSPVRQR
jgi:hypothetical protein